MSNIALLLGPIVFQDFEIPERISFGGTQRLAVHDLPGGGRIVDTLGSADTEITFAGIFSGSNAAARALELDALRVAGLTLPLTWDVFFYLTVIAGFQADYRNPSWIPFRITCTVLTSPVDIAVGFAGSLLTGLLSDTGAASAFALPAGIDLSAVGVAVGMAGATTRGTASYAQAQSGVQSGQALLNAGSVGAEAQINAVADGPNLLGATTANAGFANLATATAAAQNLAALSTAGGYLGRAATNLANAST